jgi:hypothetical protein
MDFYIDHLNDVLQVKPGSHMPALCLRYHCLQLLKHTFFCELFGWIANDNIARRHTAARIYLI